MHVAMDTHMHLHGSHPPPRPSVHNRKLLGRGGGGGSLFHGPLPVCAEQQDASLRCKETWDVHQPKLVNRRGAVDPTPPQFFFPASGRPHSNDSQAMRTAAIVVLVMTLAASALASCPNSCSGHGDCSDWDKCTCYRRKDGAQNPNGDALPAWIGPDCSLRTLPLMGGIARLGVPPLAVRYRVACSVRVIQHSCIAAVQCCWALAGCVARPAGQGLAVSIFFL